MAFEFNGGDGDGAGSQATSLPLCRWISELTFL